MTHYIVRQLKLAGIAVTVTCSPILAPASAFAAEAVPAAHTCTNKEQRMLKLRIDVEGRPITVTLDDNATARDFVSLLPLTLSLEDYVATEKVSDLPRRLSTTGAPPGITPVTGDVTYYAPWGNIAIFHEDFRYSTGLVKLGKIDAGIDILRRRGPFKVTISRPEE